MNQEFTSYRLSRIEAYNIVHSSLEKQFHGGIVDANLFEKAIAEKLNAPPSSVAPWRQSELEQLGCREGIRLAALQFYWEHKHSVRSCVNDGPGSEVFSQPSTLDFS